MVELTETKLPLPEQTAEALAVKLLEDGIALVVNATVLADTELPHPGEVLKAIPVILTTLAAPAPLNVEVVNVPAPGVPETKFKVAVVLLTVLVPLTL